MIKAPFYLTVILTLVFTYSYTSYAEDKECKEPNIPDQYHFDFCEGISTIQWDWNSSTGVINPNSSGSAVITGGKPPYTWTISGNGFSFDGAGQTTVQTDAPSISVYANLTACGSASISIDDKCSSTRGSVKSSEGQWIDLPDETGCNAFTGEYGSIHGWSYSLWSDPVNVGPYQIVEYGSLKHVHDIHTSGCADDACACAQWSQVSDVCLSSRPLVTMYFGPGSYTQCGEGDRSLKFTGYRNYYWGAYYEFSHFSVKEWVCN